MKLFTTIVCCIIVFNLSAQIKKAFATNENDILQIKKLEYKLQTALYERDTAFISKILDDNFIAVEPDRTNNKQEQLKDLYATVNFWIQDSIVTDSFHLLEMIVNQYGNAAISTFIKESFGKDLGYPFSRKIRYQNMWVKHKESWKQVSSQTARSSSDAKMDEEKIKILINQREQARLNGDKSIGNRVLARTYISIGESGTLTPKSESFDTPIDTAVFRQISESNKEIQMKIKVDSFDFRFYNSIATAVVNYRLFYNLTFNNEPCLKVFQCNEVLIKKNGFNWQSVSHTETVIPGKPFAVKINYKVYDDYVGKYRLFSKKFYTITRKGDKLWLGTRTNVELIPEDENTFVENGLNYYRIKFIKDAKGKVTHMRWIEFPGVEYSAIKVE
jgi:hypothetical protein